MHGLWHIAVIGLGLLLSLLATGHVALNKRDTRAAIAWAGFIWLVPLVGAFLYFIFGINRIRHKAALLRKNLGQYRAQAAQPECPPEEVTITESIALRLRRIPAGLIVDGPITA